MKKKNGFVFVETIIVIAVLTTALVLLYSMFTSVLSQEKRRTSFEDVAYLYRTYYLTKFYNESAKRSLVYGIDEKNPIVSMPLTTDTAKDFLKEEELGFYEQLVGSSFGITNVYLAGSNIGDLEKCDPSKTSCDVLEDVAGNNWKSYLKTLYKNDSGYRLITVFGNGDEKYGSSCFDVFEGNLTANDSTCNFYYSSIPISKPENAVEKLINISKKSSDMFIDDTEDANIRYMGADPSNYIDIGNKYTKDIYIGFYSKGILNYLEYTSLASCQTGVKDSDGTIRYNVDCKKVHSKGEPILWRIIGIMNNVDDGTGKKETRLKVIRDEVIGRIAWDHSCSKEADGYSWTEYFGRNNWVNASLNKALNEAYYNSTVTTEKNMSDLLIKHNTASCNLLDYSSNGIKDVQNIIETTVYYLGGVDDDNTSEYYNETATVSKCYQAERSDNVYGSNPTTWTGKVGLMYASDFGYATSGGTTINKKACSEKGMFNWNETTYKDCPNNNWLYNDTYEWTLSPNASAYREVVEITFGGNVAHSSYWTDYQNAVRPVFYLKSSVKIIDGEGSKLNPYKIAI